MGPHLTFIGRKIQELRHFIEISFGRIVSVIAILTDEVSPARSESLRLAFNITQVSDNLALNF
jgi:hypothetical protein